MANETKKRLLLSKWRGQLDKVDELQEQIDAHDEEVADMREALESVRWFFLDPLVHHRPMTDPRAILRKIEDVL